MRLHSRNRLLILSLFVSTLFVAFGLRGRLETSKVSTHGIFDEDPIWVYEANSRVTATPVIDGDLVYVRTEIQLIALERMTGEVLWKTQSRGDPALTLPPIAVDSRVITTQDYGNVRVLDSGSGDEMWHACAPDPNCARANSTSAVTYFDSSQSILLVGRSFYRLTAYNLDTGEIIWEQDTPGRGDVMAATDGSQVYLRRDFTFLRSYDIPTGRSVGGDIELDSLLSAFLIQNGLLYVVLSDVGETWVSAIKWATETVLWETPIASDQVPAGYLMQDEGQLFASNQNLTALSADTGAIQWQTSDIAYPSQAVVSDELVFVVEQGGNLYALDRFSGIERGAVHIGEPSSNRHAADLSAAQNDGLIVVPVGDRTVYAFSLQN